MALTVDSAGTVFTQPPPPPPPDPKINAVPIAPTAKIAAGPSPADVARTQIDDRLNGTGLFGAQTQGDDVAIADTLTGLSAQDANAVVAGLERDGRLDDLAQTITSGGPFTGSLPADARTDLFNSLAGKLDGETLASVSRAFDTIGGDRGVEGSRYAQDIGQAVSVHATSAARVDFVQALAPDTVAPGQGFQFEGGVLSQTSYQGNPQARAVGEVLSSLRGTYAQEAFSALNHEQRVSVLQAGTGETSSTYTGQQSAAPNPSYDTRLYGEITDALATMPDVHERAQAFAAGADVLRATQPEALAPIVAPTTVQPAERASDEMATSLSRLLDSNPYGIVDDLNRFQSAPTGSGDVGTYNGEALAAYSRQMLSQGQPGQEVLGQQLGLVAAGNGSSTNPTNAFNELSGDGKYRTAEALGYFIGATSAGAASLEGDAAQQNQLVGNTLASGLTLLDKSGIAATVAAVAKDWIRTAVTSINGAGATDPVTALTQAAIPEGADGYTTAASNAEAIFGGRLNHVRTNAGL